MKMNERMECVLSEFDHMFPDAKCELEHTNELELLIAVMLSAQTTDASVNRLTKTLFQKYIEMKGLFYVVTAFAALWLAA